MVDWGFPGWSPDGPDRWCGKGQKGNHHSAMGVSFVICHTKQSCGTQARGSAVCLDIQTVYANCHSYQWRTHSALSATVSSTAWLSRGRYHFYDRWASKLGRGCMGYLKWQPHVLPILMTKWERSTWRKPFELSWWPQLTNSSMFIQISNPYFSKSLLLLKVPRPYYCNTLLKIYSRYSKLGHQLQSPRKTQYVCISCCTVPWRYTLRNQDCLSDNTKRFSRLFHHSCEQWLPLLVYFWGENMISALDIIPTISTLQLIWQ